MLPNGPARPSLSGSSLAATSQPTSRQGRRSLLAGACHRHNSLHRATSTLTLSIRRLSLQTPSAATGVARCGARTRPARLLPAHARILCRISLRRSRMPTGTSTRCACSRKLVAMPQAHRLHHHRPHPREERLLHLYHQPCHQRWSPYPQAGARVWV